MEEKIDNFTCFFKEEHLKDILPFQNYSLIFASSVFRRTDFV